MRCEKCGHEWPDKYGVVCFKCAGEEKAEKPALSTGEARRAAVHPGPDRWNNMSRADHFHVITGTEPPRVLPGTEDQEAAAPGETMDEYKERLRSHPGREAAMRRFNEKWRARFGCPIQAARQEPDDIFGPDAPRAPGGDEIFE